MHDALQADALELHAHGVLVGAGDDVGAAADQRFDRARAGVEVLQLDVDAFLREVIELLGEHDGQEIELRRRPGDRDGDALLLDLLAERRRCREDARDERGDERQVHPKPPLCASQHEKKSRRLGGGVWRLRPPTMISPSTMT